MPSLRAIARISPRMSSASSSIPSVYMIFLSLCCDTGPTIDFQLITFTCFFCELGPIRIAASAIDVSDRELSRLSGMQRARLFIFFQKESDRLNLGIDRFECHVS